MGLLLGEKGLYRGEMGKCWCRGGKWGNVGEEEGNGEMWVKRREMGKCWCRGGKWGCATYLGGNGK